MIDFLKASTVANNIYQGIMSEKEEVYLPFYQQIVFRVILMLPTWISDPLNLWLSNQIIYVCPNKIGKDAMKGFVGREKKVE